MYDHNVNWKNEFLSFNHVEPCCCFSISIAKNTRYRILLPNVTRINIPIETLFEMRGSQKNSGGIAFSYDQTV